MNDLDIWQAINSIIKDLIKLQQAVEELSKKINEKNGVKKDEF